MGDRKGPAPAIRTDRETRTFCTRRCDIETEEKHTKCCDLRDPAYSILARSLIARRDNLTATIAALQERLSRTEVLTAPTIGSATDLLCLHEQQSLLLLG
jgi:hypothetical protein